MLPGRRITPASADAVVWCRSCISKAFFFWANPIITTAYNRGKREAGGLLESDLFDLRLAIAGEVRGSDQMQVCQGGLDEDRFIVLFGREKILCGAVAMKRPRALNACRQLIRGGASFEQALAELG